MTEPSAKIVADSVSEEGHRLTTFEVTFHRFILAEVNTHRVLSRNSASSRAIPITVKLDEFLNDPAFPVFWTAERPGMTAKEELAGDDLMDAQILFRNIQEATGDLIQRYLDDHAEKGTRLHKSLLNRPLEWASWQTAVISSTEWSNFFGLRCSPLAQPEFEVVANLMYGALNLSEPKILKVGKYHLPYIEDAEHESMDERDLTRIATARCCRVSTVHQGEHKAYEADYALFARLCDPGEGLPHASPLEHVATPCDGWAPGNFTGYRQLRHDVLTEAS